MKALVTGARGFIGSHLVEALLKKKYEVRCLLRKKKGGIKPPRRREVLMLVALTVATSCKKPVLKVMEQGPGS